MEKLETMPENLISFSPEETKFLNQEFGDVRTFIIRAKKNIEIVGDPTRDRYKMQQIHKALLEGDYNKLKNERDGRFSLFVSALGKVISACNKENKQLKKMPEEEIKEKKYSTPEQLDLFLQ